jgi:hypothetical protein
MKKLTWITMLFLLVVGAGQVFAVDTICLGVSGAQLIAGDVVLLSSHETVPGSDRSVLGLRVLNLTTGESRLLTDPVTQYPIGEIVSPDGQKVVFQPQDMLTGDTSVEILNLVDDSRDGIAIPYNEGKTLSGYRWLPDSSGLLLAIRTDGSDDGTGFYIYRPGQELEPVIDFPGVRNFSIGNFSPDGNHLVVAIQGHQSTQLFDFELSTRQLTPMISFVQTLVSGLDWNADQTQVLINGYTDQFNANIWIFDGTNFDTIDQSEDGIIDAMWSPSDPSLLVELISTEEEGLYPTFTIAIKDVNVDDGQDLHAYVGAVDDWFWFDPDHLMLLSNGAFNLLDIHTLQSTTVYTVCQ